MRASANWNNGCSRITELPSRERDEDVVERRVMRRERRELQIAPLKQRQQRRKRPMQLGHGQRKYAGAGPYRSDPAQATQRIRQVVRRSIDEGELDDVLGTERRDQLAGRPQRD